MKKNRLGVAVFGLLIFLFSSCQVAYFLFHPKVKFTDAYIKSQDHQFTVETPEIFELVNVAYALSENGQKHPWMVNKKKNYYNEVRNYFAAYTTHPLILKLNKKVKKDYQYYFEERDNAYGYEFSNDKIVTNNYKNLHGIHTIGADLDLWEDFAKESKYKRFYEFHKEYYQQVIANIKKLLSLNRMWAWLENKFSNKYNSYKIVVSPLIYGSHSTSRVMDKDFIECIMFVSDAERDTSRYKPEVFQGLYARVVFTEIDHNYVNPVSEKFKKQIKTAMRDLNAWNNGKQGYDNTQMTFNEYMTWAVFSLYLKDNYLKDDFDAVNNKTVDMMVNYRGFTKFSEFDKKLLELYEKNPENIEGLYPEIINWMNSRN
ncbi:MAG: DUF4932 domain-containing protein [Bacteroidia bacterium]|nr:DUF4932 domain-containing protein [Bacteroidia bacterium]